MSRMDNFDRAVWMVFGACLGVVVTSLVGWYGALGWLLGWGVGSLLIYAIGTGRLVLRRRPQRDIGSDDGCR